MTLFPTTVQSMEDRSEPLSIAKISSMGCREVIVTAICSRTLSAANVRLCFAYFSMAK